MNGNGDENQLDVDKLNTQQKLMHLRQRRANAMGKGYHQMLAQLDVLISDLEEKQQKEIEDKMNGADERKSKKARRSRSANIRPSRRSERDSRRRQTD